VTGQVAHDDVRFELRAGQLGAGDRHRGGLDLQLTDGCLRRGLELARGRDDAEVAAEPVQHPQHEEVAAKERMPRQVLTRLAEYRRNGCVLRGRHVARLATALLDERAVAPFQIRHLLRQRSDDVTLRPERVRVERVTGGAHLRFPQVLRLHRPSAGCRSHDRGAALIGIERTEHSGISVLGQPEDESAVEAVARPQRVGSNLMTQRTGHAVGGEPVIVGMSGR
jgi:hypothetical protein